MPQSFLDYLRGKLVPQAPPTSSGAPLGTQDMPGSNPNAPDPIGDVVQGILGTIGLGNQNDKANQFGQLVSAGLPVMHGLEAAIPFAAPLGKVFHGSPTALPTASTDEGLVEGLLNPTYNRIHDLLGSFQHFAEDPGIAAEFTHDRRIIANKPPTPSVVAAVPHAQNALDLTQPLPDEDWTALRQTAMGNAAAPSAAWAAVLDDLKQSGLPQEKVNSTIVNMLTEYPQLLSKAGFDGVKYFDYVGSRPSSPVWAIPATTPVTTPWGTPLTAPAIHPDDAARLVAHPELGSKLTTLLNWTPKSPDWAAQFATEPVKTSSTDVHDLGDVSEYNPAANHFFYSKFAFDPTTGASGYELHHSSDGGAPFATFGPGSPGAKGAMDLQNMLNHGGIDLHPMDSLQFANILKQLGGRPAADFGTPESLLYALKKLVP